MPTKISPAALRHRLKLQSRSSTQDTSGQEILTWTDVLTCWAAIEPAAGREQLAAEAQVSTVSHVVTIRYRAGITARMRAVYASRVFEIVSVIDVDEMHFWLQLDCVEGLTRG